MISINRSFMKGLKSMDRKLDCIFHPGIEKFIVTYERATGTPVPIAQLAGREGMEFRQPCERDLEFIKSGDMESSTVNEKLSRTAQYMERVRERQREVSRSNIRNRTLDDKIQLTEAAKRVDGGKGKSAFRRITPKPKGKVF